MNTAAAARSEINRRNAQVGLEVRRQGQAERDTAIKRLRSRGWSYREVAAELSCSVGTVAAAVERLERIRHTNFPPKVTHYSENPKPDHGLPHPVCNSHVLGWDILQADWDGVDCDHCLDKMPAAPEPELDEEDHAETKESGLTDVGKNPLLPESCAT